MQKLLLLIIVAISLGGTYKYFHDRLDSSQAAAALSTPQQPTRSVQGQVLSSTGMPAIRLKFNQDFKYIGSQDFILYDVARAEQHFFVDADKQGRIRRLYWVQFEGYLPSNTNTYRYKANKTVNIGGFDFIADSYARNTKTNPGRADSDGSRARAYLEKQGYHMMSDEVLSQRLVHLVDEEKRNELMIIYLEAMSGVGISAADFAPGGSAAARWEVVAKGLLERATYGIEISR